MVDVLTFGCRLNIEESEAIRRAAADQGDLTIINSCAVTAAATREAGQAVRRLRRERPGTRIIVTGCAAQTEPSRFLGMEEVDSVIGNGRKADADAYRAAAAGQRDLVGDIAVSARPTLVAPAAFSGRTRAFVQVQNGCDHRCTFCIIPYGRGASRSVEPDVVIDQVRRLSEHGHREVVLTGVDLTSYGGDLAARPRLGDLVRVILDAVPRLERLRLSSLDAIEVDAVLLECLADARLMPHLHLSLQSGDDLILKRMKRRHGADDALRLADAARARRPDIVFGADLIAGFPTETEAAFERSLALIDRLGIDHVHAFPYSARPGTPAARMPAVPGPAIAERARRLREAGAARLARTLAAEVGRQRSVLAERGGGGRTEHFFAVRLEGPVDAGDIRTVRISGSDGRVLSAAA